MAYGRRRGSRQYVWACVVALLACLALAPNAVADPGSASPAAADAAPGASGGTPAAEQAAKDDKGGPEQKGGDDANGGGAPANTAGAAAPKDDTGKNAKDEAGAAAPKEDTGKDAKDGAGKGPDKAAEDAEGASKPDQQANKGGSVGQSAEASASADQKDTGNKHEDVRVDKPGNGPHVDQRNEAKADAEATAQADVPETTTVAQNADAGASAAQSDVSNTAVTVRVESPGDNGGVTQVNEAAGSANAAAEGSQEGVAAADASATQDDASNTNVSVRVFSPGDDGSVSQHNDASATAAADGGSPSGAASALQDDVRNTNVSIRVESPGTPGEVSQDSTARADVSGRREDEGEDDEGGAAVAVTTNAVDTAVAVVVNGAALDRPGTLEVWEWTWTWLHDESESLSGAIEAELSSWTWSWDDTAPTAPEGRGSVRSRTATADEAAQTGTWSWSWDWQRSGVDNWSWQWSWRQTLECGGCIWIWSWSWLWSGAPAAADAGAGTDSPAQPDLSGGQINSAQAVAEASVAANIDQSAEQEAEGAASQYAGQLADVLQAATAVSMAHQENVRSISAGGMPFQSNIARSETEVLLDATTTQTVTQLLGVDDPGAGGQWSGQHAETLQAGAAGADATQVNAVLTGPGSHEATATARADAAATVAQDVVQDGLVGGGSLDQWAGQLSLVEQLVQASAKTTQSGTLASRRTGAAADASAAAGDLLFVDQTIGQGAVRIAGEGTQEAEQLVAVAQDAAAGATTTQQAGGASVAQSAAIAGNRAAVVQTATQVASSSSGFDHQQLTQQSIVVQGAYATSTSLGGIAGTAAVSNCAVTRQSADQAIGATGTVAPGFDVTGFCRPPAPAVSAAEPQARAAGGAPSALEHVLVGTPAPIGRVSVPASDVMFQAEWPGAAPHGYAGTSDHAFATGFGAPRPTVGSQAASTQSSALPSTQARLDTRPGSHAGDGDAGREPPLPPAGDPPMWISALAAAASSTGPSGIAAILLAFVLVPPVVRRAREGSVVRRPATVFARAEVPV